MDFRLPIPKTWQDFESICHQLWKDIWNDPNAQKNGRQGQPQHGVDVFGVPAYSSGIAGVQCKDKDERLGSALAEEDLNRECSKARGFAPRLHAFTIATTAPRDAGIQEVARKLTLAEDSPFKVHVWSWDDIEAEIQHRPHILQAYYRGIAADHASSAALKLSGGAPADQLAAFFSRPKVEAQIHSSLRSRLVQTLYELSDNAFTHGRASEVQIAFDGSTIRLSDNGIAFDPLTRLDSSLRNPRSHFGSYVIDLLRTQFAHAVELNYSRTQDGKGGNLLEIHLRCSVQDFKLPEVLDIPVDVGLALGRGAARRLASTIPIPAGVRRIVLTIGKLHNISAFVEFVYEVLARLPADVRLSISLSSSDFISGMESWIPDPRLSIQPR